MPQLSVLMPAKNAGVYIKQSLESALNALPNDSELVVLNDGSTDETGDVLDHCSDSRLRVVTKATSLGVVGASNFLMSITDSRYVARIDADDLCTPLRFRRQLRQIPQNDFVFSRVTYIDAQGKRLGSEKFPSLNSRVIPTHLLLGNMLSNPTMFARRESLESLGGFHKATSEDYDLWMRAASSGFRLKKTFSPLVSYRLHPAQATASDSWNDNIVDPILLSSYSELAENILGIRPEFSANAFPQISAPFLLLTADSQKIFNAAFKDHISQFGLFDRGVLSLRKRTLELIFKKQNGNFDDYV